MLLRLPDPATRARARADDPETDPGPEPGRGASPTAEPGPSLATERELAVEFVGCFEGWSLVTVACDHRPYWLLTELSGALGVEDPTHLLAALAQRWLESCPEGAIVQLVGGDRRELLDKLDRAHVVLAPTHHRKPITLLGPPAIDELCACFDSATARRLKAHLRDQVVPEFHAWERATRALERPILSVDAAAIAANRLEFERRCFEAAVLERLLDRLEQAGLVAPDLLTAHRVVASELALGGCLEDYRESLAHGWSTPTQIAESWCGMTAMRVGKVIAHLGLKGSRAHSRAFLNKARGHDRTVISHVYSPAAVGLIERELRSRGHRRCAALDELETTGAAT
ncbi:hypothetical protein ENSA5_46430 [Enhygromyxa salina]|uniref:Bro-N domain-containing protein n=1 Tax=Enhygromyxa salina TaxID=215803 RepID=A0A2S9XJ26_9BACT|nr:hypothetical protein [Enhygromyxa salina]PRP92878.1 hypothetical protein ENSA5_46430 [Enhygromyxa salina]